MIKKSHQIIAVLVLLSGFTKAFADSSAAPAAPAATPPAAAPADLSGEASAKAGDPNGTWTWSLTRGGKTSTFTLKLAFKDGKLDGTLKSGESENKIGDASYNGGQVAFSITHEGTGGGKEGEKTRDAGGAAAAATGAAAADAKPAAPPAPVVTKYAGTLSGDTITGTVERPEQGRQVAQLGLDRNSEQVRRTAIETPVALKHESWN